MAAMLELLRKTALHPLNLPALMTWLAVALSLPHQGPTGGALLWTMLLVFALAFMLHDFAWAQAPRTRALLFALEALCALGTCWLAPRGGVSPALLVMLIAHLALVYPIRRVYAVAAALNLALYLILRQAGHGAAFIVVLIFAGLQGFAVLVAHYARNAERTRDRLALVNADLLATRALLADSARSNERLRVARDLHDVVGHKLTAMILNLRSLAMEPSLQDRGEVQVAQRLATELLAEIRSVVQALREERGLDLALALRALAAPLPRPALALRIDEAVRLTDTALAETLLRVVQEALTNSARHTEAQRVEVDIQRDGAHLRLRIQDDGRVRAPLAEGNGLSGMRERVAAAGGRLRLSAQAGAPLRIEAEFPFDDDAANRDIGPATAGIAGPLQERAA